MYFFHLESLLAHRYYHTSSAKMDHGLFPLECKYNHYFYNGQGCFWRQTCPISVLYHKIQRDQRRGIDQSVFLSVWPDAAPSLAQYALVCVFVRWRRRNNICQKYVLCQNRQLQMSICHWPSLSLMFKIRKVSKVKKSDTYSPQLGFIVVYVVFNFIVAIMRCIIFENQNLVSFRSNFLWGKI